jgi:hypothetical protein
MKSGALHKHSFSSNFCPHGSGAAVDLVKKRTYFTLPRFQINCLLLQSKFATPCNSGARLKLVNNSRLDILLQDRTF